MRPEMTGMMDRRADRSFSKYSAVGVAMMAVNTVGNLQCAFSPKNNFKTFEKTLFIERPFENKS